MNKKQFTFLVALFIAVSLFGQLPEKTSILEGNNQKMATTPAALEQISYQAVVRDANNATVANQVVGMQISVLQTTANGTAVYAETQTPTTNANGLLSIYIGAGSAVTATFSVIDWSSGPYFIKIEIDPSGDNANYIITGTTQLVSVPFALYAKTAGNDLLKENTANKSTSIILDAASDLKFPSVKSVKTYVDIVQADVDANETASTSSDANLQAYIDALEARIVVFEQATIGDLRAGGVVFWVDPADNTHGLVCALEGVNTEFNWGDATRYSIGYTNSDTGTGVYSNWYLPSKEELQFMYANLQRFGCSTETPGGSDDNGFCATRKGNFSNSYYWSSTEIDGNNAWRQSFGNGVQNGNDKIEANTVRPVRAF
jgi:hypothetical protein